MKIILPRLESAKLFGSAVLSQALLSGASFIVGLLLIRHTSDMQYGYYVLAWNAVLLLVTLHNAFVNPVMVERLTPLDARSRGELVGGIFREQSAALAIAAACAVIVCVALWSLGWLDANTGPLIIATVIAAFATLERNFFRMVLLAHRRPHDVLACDITYVILLIAGTMIATQVTFSGTATLFGMAIAALLSGALAARLNWRNQPWNLRGARGILRAIAPIAALSTAGGAIHWAFSQGYMYLAAGMLDVTAVAAIAATRMLMMPINLLSTGIGGLMLPLTAEWVQRHGGAFALRRLGLVAAAMASITVCYFIVLWIARDWVFAVLLKKQFTHRDQLLLLWALAFFPMTIRDQLLYYLVSCQRFRQLMSLGFIGALVSLFAGYVGMREFGVVGGPLGVIFGETLSMTGILILSLRHAGIVTWRPRAWFASRAVRS